MYALVDVLCHDLYIVYAPSIDSKGSWDVTVLAWLLGFQVVGKVGVVISQ